MGRLKLENCACRDSVRWSVAVSAFVVTLWAAGCGGSNAASNPSTPQTGPQAYFAPTVSGAPVSAATTFSFDEKASTFSQSQSGPQVLNAGKFTISQRGLRSLDLLTTYVKQNTAGSPVYMASNFDPPKTGSFAVELANQAGGLVQLVGQPAMPLVAAASCPNFSSTQTYQFITIPGAFLPAGTAPVPGGWDPTTETAFGSVDISSSGSTINFQNFHQFTLPSVGGSGAPLQAPVGSITGSCAQTYYGYTITVPEQATVSNPGVPGSGGSIVSPQATIGIDASGLMVEDNGAFSGGTLADSMPALPYDNVMGAGSGAVGLPKPSSALDTGAIVGAQYLGFIYAAGASVGSTSWSSHLASFGFATAPSGCSSVAASTNTLIYGGDFPQVNGQDNPSASPDGFGNCDFAIDLGTQDPNNNGRYPHATVWVGTGYATHSTGRSFPGLAIAGQVNGKYALLLIGLDSSQPWAIYLLQSN